MQTLAIIVARAIRTAGLQVFGSGDLVTAPKYVPGPKKVVYFGVFTSLYQLSEAIGVRTGGCLLAGVAVAGPVLFSNTMNWWFVVAFLVLTVPFVLSIINAHRPFGIRAFPTATRSATRRRSALSARLPSPACRGSSRSGRRRTPTAGATSPSPAPLTRKPWRR